MQEQEKFFKIVYYGPGLGGKTENLVRLYESLPRDCVAMRSAANKTDREMILELALPGLPSVRIALHTEPGWVFYDDSWEGIFRGASGVVFVADTQKACRDRNLEFFVRMDENLRRVSLDPETIPYVLQLNKRDLPELMSREELAESFARGSHPVIESCALSGKGVLETFRAIVEGVVAETSAIDWSAFAVKPSTRTAGPSVGKIAAKPEVKREVKDVSPLRRLVRAFFGRA